MITITIALEDEIAQLLEQATTRRRSSPEEVITIALKHYWGEIIDEDVIDGVDDPLVGLFDLGDPNLAEQAEDILQAAIQPHSGWTSKV